MIPNNICVVRSTNKGCTHWCIHEASRSMSKNGFVWKCSSKIPWTILLPFKKLQFSSGYPYGISKKTWIKRNGSTPRYGSKLGNPPSKHGWSWLGHPRSKWRFLEGEPPMAQFSNGSWWISSFASGSWRKSIRKGGFTIKNGGLAINKMVVEPTRNGFSMIQFDLQYFHYPLNYPKPTSLAPENPRSQRKELFSNSSTHGYVARSSTLVVGSPMSCPSKPQAKVPWQHMDPSCGIKQLGMDKAIPKGQPWKADYSIFLLRLVRPSPTSPWSLENQSQHSQWNLVLLIKHPIFSRKYQPGVADFHQVKIIQHIRGSQNHPLGDPASCTSPNPSTSSEISTWTHLWCDGAIVMALVLVCFMGAFMALSENGNFTPKFLDTFESSHCP